MTRSSPLLPLAAALAALWATAAAAQGAQEKEPKEPRPRLFHTPLKEAVADEPFTVEGLLLDGKRVDKIFLRFRNLGQPFRTAEMEIQYGDLYRGVIPARWVVAPALEYFVQGVTFDGQPVLLYQSERKPTRVRVVPAAQKGGAPDAGPREGKPGTSRGGRRANQQVRPGASLPRVEPAHPRRSAMAE